jgi:hypothetical protein
MTRKETLIAELDAVLDSIPEGTPEAEVINSICSLYIRLPKKSEDCQTVAGEIKALIDSHADNSALHGTLKTIAGLFAELFQEIHQELKQEAAHA